MNASNNRPVAVAIATLTLLTAAGLGLTLPSRAADDTKKSAPKPALTVTTVQPQTGQLSVRLAANGSIAAWQEAIIGSEANGLRLTEVRVNVGDAVRKGDVLAVMASDAIRAEIAQAKASLAEAQATAAEAASNAERARTLQTSGALSASQINQYLTAEQTARARVESAQALLQMQQVRLAQTQVLAPDNGVITNRLATVGSVVGAGTELFRMIRQGRLEWRAEVTSAELGRIARGTPVQITSASGAKTTGRVRMVAPSVDPQTRNGLVYVDLAAVAGANTAAILPGMFARGEFELGATGALTVPQSAVVVRDGFSYVYRLGADQRVAQLKVQTGRIAGDRIEITSGLTADARLVASGAGFLNDGDLVRLAPEPGKAPAPANAAQGATK